MYLKANITVKNPQDRKMTWKQEPCEGSNCQGWLLSGGILPNPGDAELPLWWLYRLWWQEIKPRTPSKVGLLGGNTFIKWYYKGYTLREGSKEINTLACFDISTWYGQYFLILAILIDMQLYLIVILNLLFPNDWWLKIFAYAYLLSVYIFWLNICSKFLSVF